MKKHSRTFNRLVILGAILAVLTVASMPLLLKAQSEFSLRWGNISSGYGISHGDGYRVAGTAGEVDGGASLTGDGFSVTGGFWSGVDEPPPFVTPQPPTPTPPPSAEYQIYLPSTIDR